MITQRTKSETYHSTIWCNWRRNEEKRWTFFGRTSKNFVSMLLSHSLYSSHKFSMERVNIAFSMEHVIAFSIEHVLVGNVMQLHRNFGVPAAFHFAFHLRSSNAFPVRLLLSGTVLHKANRCQKWRKPSAKKQIDGKLKTTHTKSPNWSKTS